MKRAMFPMQHPKAARRGLPAFLALAAFLVAAPAAPAAQDSLSVASGELAAAQSSKLVFVNYEGPQSVIQSAAEITAIGSGLGQAFPRITAGTMPAAPLVLRAGDTARYAVIRVVDPTVKTGLDADIIVIGADAQVDHVKNLRRIVSGYLQAAWGYSSADASTLATYITIYNAAHRGDLAYVEAKYKPAVRAELTADNVGLSLRYDEWPGKSRILVPLARGAKSGALGAVDTGAVSDKATVDSMKAQPGAGLGDRQSMTELKDREAAQRAADLAKQQADIAKAQADLDAKNAALAAERARLEADKAAAAQPDATARPAAAAGETAGAAPAGTAASATGAGATATGTEAAQPAGAQGNAGAAGAAQQASLTDREAALKAEEAKAAADQAALDRQKADAAQAAADLAAKKDEAAADRAGIAADQKAGIAADVAAKGQAEAAGIYLYQLVDATAALASIVYVDAQTGKLIRASNLNAIRPWGVIEEGDSFVAVAGKATGTGAVRLVRLAKADLQQQAQGTADLFPNTGLWKDGESFYAVVKDGAGWKLARFDRTLAVAATSPGQVNPWTALAPGKDGLVVQGAGGAFQVLAPDTLRLVREFKP